MALLQVNYLSKTLFRTVPLNVILPSDKIDYETLSYKMKEGEKFKTLYLLHGLLGNYTDWVSNTRIQLWAEEKNLLTKQMSPGMKTVRATSGPSGTVRSKKSSNGFHLMKTITVWEAATFGQNRVMDKTIYVTIHGFYNAFARGALPPGLVS